MAFLTASQFNYLLVKKDWFTTGSFLSAHPWQTPLWVLPFSRHCWGWGRAGEREYIDELLFCCLLLSPYFLQPHQRKKSKTPNMWQYFKSDLVSYCRFGSFAFLAPSTCNCIHENQHTETEIIFPMPLQNKVKVEYCLEIHTGWTHLSAIFRL